MTHLKKCNLEESQLSCFSLGMLTELSCFVYMCYGSTYSKIKLGSYGLHLLNKIISLDGHWQALD